MKAWRVHGSGRPSEVLHLDDVDVPAPGPGEVRIRTAASALNFNEVDGCRGRYLTVNPPIPYTLGMEVVGEVVACGAGAEGWLGRRVMAGAKGAFGGHAEEVIAPTTMVFDVPDDLDDAAAAAFFFPFHLAHLGLHERGRVQAGETVLVHAAAGGVGSAAVQLAVAAGARVIATAGGDEKVSFCKQLGADVAIDHRGGFVDAVLDATGERGVDVCFDGVGGPVMLDSLRCLGRNGRHLVVGFASGIEAEDEPLVTGRMLCFGNFSIVGVLLSYTDEPGRLRRAGINATPRAVGDAVHAELVGLLGDGAIRPIVGRTVPFDDLPFALDAMEERQTIGRVIVERSH
jgi:NADPH2:quinone reductase